MQQPNHMTMLIEYSNVVFLCDVINSRTIWTRDELVESYTDTVISSCSVMKEPDRENMFGLFPEHRNKAY